MLPDLPILDHEQPTETSDQSREQMMRKARIEATSQAAAVAKTNRALRTKITTTCQHYYDDGNLVDYHRPTTAEDDWGGWNGPFPVARNDPERGQVIIRVGSRDVQVQCGDARHSLYIEALIARDWFRQHCATDSVDARGQFTLCPDQEGDAPDDKCNPTIS
eukprot:6029262-Pyramimonas_sp.AAC.1